MRHIQFVSVGFFDVLFFTQALYAASPFGRHGSIVSSMPLGRRSSLKAALRGQCPDAPRPTAPRDKLKAGGATLDRFGILSPGIVGSKVKIWLDDLQYTAGKP